MFELGGWYDEGVHVPLDLTKAFQWYVEAARAGHPGGVFNAANCLRNGWGCEPNFDVAETLFAQAGALGVEQGLVEVMKLQMLRSMGAQPTPNPHPALVARASESNKLLTQAEAQQDRAARFALLQQAADAGNGAAMVQLGLCYVRGDGVEADENEQAVTWFGRAVAQGQLSPVRALASEGLRTAQLAMAMANKEGVGVVADRKVAENWARQAAEQGLAPAQVYYGLLLEGTRPGEAFALFRRAADQGWAEAQLQVGRCLEYGTGTLQDREQAIEWYRKAADQGYVNALKNLGTCYELGHGVPQSDAEAVRYFQLAADKGHATALHNLGTCYLHGELGLPKDPAQAERYFREAVNKGNVASAFNLGVMFVNGTGVPADPEQAVHWFRLCHGENHEGAERALGLALAMLGNEYLAGRGGAAPDPAAALQCFAEGAQLDAPEAQRGLAMCYLSGTGLEQDENAAMALLQAAAAQGDEAAAQKIVELGGTVEQQEVDVAALEAEAEAGNADAQHQLGSLYLCGDAHGGVPKDGKRACHWLRRAAEQGVVDAQSDLGEVYEFGLAGPVDLKQAVAWYRKAASSGSGLARLNLALCLYHGRGVAVDVAEAERLVAESVEDGFDIVDITVEEEDAEVAEAADADGAAADADADAEPHMSYVISFANGTGNMLHSAGHLVAWCRLFALRGSMAAQYQLGLSYRLGRGTPADAAEAARWFKLAADQGYVPAQFELAECHAYGRGVAPDRREAVRLYELAALQDHGPALLALALCHRYGLGVVNDEAVANQLLGQAVDLSFELEDLIEAPNGDAVLVFENGERYILPDDPESWLHWCRMFADHANPRAQFRLGQYHVGADEEAEAVSWFRRSAEQNDPFGQLALAVCLAYGLGGQPADLPQARLLVQAAAAAGFELEAVDTQCEPEVATFANGETCQLAGAADAARWAGLAAKLLHVDEDN